MVVGCQSHTMVWDVVGLPLTWRASHNPRQEKLTTNWENTRFFSDSPYKNRQMTALEKQFWLKITIFCPRRVKIGQNWIENFLFPKFQILFDLHEIHFWDQKIVSFIETFFGWLLAKPLLPIDIPTDFLSKNRGLVTSNNNKTCKRIWVELGGKQLFVKSRLSLYRGSFQSRWDFNKRVGVRIKKAR